MLRQSKNGILHGNLLYFSEITAIAHLYDYIVLVPKELSNLATP